MDEHELKHLELAKKTAEHLHAAGKHHEAISICERALASIDALMAAKPHDIRLAIYNWAIHMTLGDSYAALHNLDQASKAYEEALRLSNTIIVNDSAAVFQKTRYDVFKKIAGIRLAQGRRGDGLQLLLEARNLAMELAVKDPKKVELHNDVLVCTLEIGDAQLALAQLQDALQSYRLGLSMADRMAKSQPNEKRWQSQLAGALERLATLLQFAKGQELESMRLFLASIDIEERLGKSEPHNLDRQRNLSVIYNKLGEIKQRQGKMAEALDSFSKSLLVREGLAKSRPDDVRFQEDLAGAYARVSEAYHALRQRDKELNALQNGKAIMDRLVKLSPENATWKSRCDWLDDQIAALPK